MTREENEYNTVVSCCYTFQAAFPAPTFAYCFPFLRALLLQYDKLVTMDQRMTMNALAVLSAHAQLRDPEGKSEDEINEVREVMCKFKNRKLLGVQCIKVCLGALC